MQQTAQANPAFKAFFLGFITRKITKAFFGILKRRARERELFGARRLVNTFLGVENTPEGGPITSRLGMTVRYGGLSRVHSGSEQAKGAISKDGTRVLVFLFGKLTSPKKFWVESLGVF